VEIAAASKVEEMSTIKRINALFFFITALLYVAVPAQGESPQARIDSCDRENISIYYEAEDDYLNACEGIARAEKFFLQHNYPVSDDQISLCFSPPVIFDEDSDFLKDAYGYCKPDSKSIFLRSISSPFIRDSEKSFFKLRLESEFMLKEHHISIITHEIAHIFAQYNFDLLAEFESEIPKMGTGVQEYIAYVVQLSSIEKSILKLILQQYNPHDIFSHEHQINELVFALDPEKFGIMAYRHFYSLFPKQQRNILKRIFSNELNPDRLLEIFLQE